MVLIESDWNLKFLKPAVTEYSSKVLIESDWNLKRFPTLEPYRSAIAVLIESDWNLKSDGIRPVEQDAARINRIRLEFKAHSS